MSLPLHGCVVLDLGIITAGAGASAVLADLGAAVIKIESPAYRDPFRRWPAGQESTSDTEDSPFFRSTNRNKHSLSLDLKQPRGREAFLRLVRCSHVVTENFRRGVLARLGLDFPVLAAVNPAIILASISSQGETGADAEHVSFGSTLEAMGGLAWTTGYEGDDPLITGRELNYPDQVATVLAAGMIATAVRAQRQGARAVHLDLSQRELTSFLCGECFVAPEHYTGESARSGNAQAPYALQECFAARDGRWVAVSVRPDQLTLLGSLPAWSPQPDTSASLAAWIAAHDAAEVVSALRALTVAVAVSTNGSDLIHGERQWRHALAHDSRGQVVKGFAFQFRETPMRVYRDPVPLGSDSRSVLIERAGYSPQEVEELIGAGIVGIVSDPSAAVAV